MKSQKKALNHMDIIRNKILRKRKSSAFGRNFSAFLSGILRLKHQKRE